MPFVFDMSGVVKLARKFKMLEREYPDAALKTTQEAAKIAVIGLKNLAPRWRGYLRASFRSRRNENGYDVLGAGYAFDVDRGGPIIKSPKLKLWAKDKGIPLNRLLKKKISSPHPYIDEVKATVKASLPTMIQQNSQLALMKSGFGKGSR